MSGYKVQDWMISPAVVVDPDTCVAYALTVMRRRNIHSLVVNLTGKENGYGIVTTTDIRDKILAADRNPADVSIRDIMTAPVQTAQPGWSLKECSIQMQKLNVHHMPVMDLQGELVGMISATDLFFAVEEAGWETDYFPD